MINKHVDLFTVEMVDSPSGLVPIVYCLDISTFLTLTLSERGIGVKDVVLRLSIDEGRGLTKISGSLIYKDPENEHDNALSSSVKRIHILSIAPVKESYTMIEIMFQKLKIHEYPGDLDCFFVQDLKSFNLCMGLGNHRSKHSCIFCKWTTGF